MEHVRGLIQQEVEAGIPLNRIVVGGFSQVRAVVWGGVGSLQSDVEGKRNSWASPYNALSCVVRIVMRCGVVHPAEPHRCGWLWPGVWREGGCLLSCAAVLVPCGVRS